jgi:hypothetical protein
MKHKKYIIKTIPQSEYIGGQFSLLPPMVHVRVQTNNLKMI